MADAQVAQTQLFVIRHGESNATVQRRIGGPLSCTGLSELGRQQAARLRDRVTNGGLPAIDELWASTMPRAKETADILNEELGLELRLEKEFEELRPGQADGMLFTDFFEKYGSIDQIAEPDRELFPGGESRSTFFSRVGGAFDDLLASRQGKTILVVCHGGVVDVVFRRLLGVGDQTPFQMWTINTSINEFITTDHGPPRRWRLARYNDSAHLHGLPAATPPATG